MLDNLRIGRGIAFHITPSNVPLNFAYSFGRVYFPEIVIL